MEINWLGLIVVVGFVLTLSNGILLRRKLEFLQRDSKLLEDQLSQDMVGVSNGSIGVGRRLMELEHEYRKLVTRLDTLEHDDPSRVAYTEASRLVNLGAEIEDLISSCGISRPEAELVSAVHKRNAQVPMVN